MISARRVGLGMLALACAGAVSWWGLAGNRFDPDAARRAARGRDVIVLTLDTTRADRLGCYGHGRDTSPALDALARRGVRFEVAYASTPITLPSHASIFTGLFPPRHGIHNNGTYQLAGSVDTLAERLQKGGYRTAAFIASVVLDARHGLDQGFELYDDDLAGGFQETRFALLRRNGEAVVDAALAWLRERDENEPVFLWLHFFDPHRPYTPPEALRRRFGNGDGDLYDAEVRSMDDAIGRFEQEVERLGRDPVWAVLADHGEGLGEHGEGAHGIFLYEGTTRIPFILAARGALPRRVTQTVARQVDLLPTILDLVGLPIPDDLDGASLLDRIAGAPEEREVYLETLLPYEDYGWSPLFGYVKNRWKYVAAPRPELYHLAADPTESRDLSRVEPPRTQALKGALEKLLLTVSGEAPRLELDGGAAAALRSIGYATGGGLAQPGEKLPDPKDMIELFQQVEAARTLLVLGPGRDPLRAFQLLEEVVGKNPGNGEALSLLGFEAIREVQLNPGDPNRELYLDHARRAFGVFARRAPGRPEGEYGLGLIALQQRDLAAACSHFEAVLAIDDTYLPNLETLMDIEYRRGQWLVALRHAEGILRVDRKHREATRITAMARFRVGHFEPAIEAFERLPDPAKGNERDALHFYLGECHRNLHQYRRALEHYGKIEGMLRQSQNVAALEEQCRAAL